MNPLIIGGVVIGLLALWMVAPEINKALQKGGFFGITAGEDISMQNLQDSDQGEPIPQNMPIDERLRLLESKGLWQPSTPISETPELMTKIKVGRDVYVQP